MAREVCMATTWGQGPLQRARMLASHAPRRRRARPAVLGQVRSRGGQSARLQDSPQWPPHQRPWLSPARHGGSWNVAHEATMYMRRVKRGSESDQIGDTSRPGATRTPNMQACSGLARVCGKSLCMTHEIYVTHTSCVDSCLIRQPRPHLPPGHLARCTRVLTVV